MTRLRQGCGGQANRHTRWFRRLLKLLPADFQADYARDMEQTFRAQQRDGWHSEHQRKQHPLR